LSQIAAINATFVGEIRSLNASWEKRMEAQKIALLQDLRAKFEEEKAQLLASLKAQHEANIK
jgi:hypothetical protein